MEKIFQIKAGNWVSGLRFGPWVSGLRFGPLGWDLGLFARSKFKGGRGRVNKVEYSPTPGRGGNKIKGFGNGEDNQKLEKKKQGLIHGNPVADGWAGASLRKPLAVYKCDGRTETARCRVA